MGVFSNVDFDNHERVIFHKDEETGLRCIIAVHNTNRGPALGGTRMWEYADESLAISDALRLSRGMTYKNAIANLPLGGGKAVIIGNSRTEKTKDLLLAYGRLVDSLNGVYLTAEDVGMTVQDMEIIRSVTSYAHGLADKAGNPSPATAYGTYLGIKAAVKHKFDRDDLEDISVSVQGVGSVGEVLCEYLHNDGARLMVSDINLDAVDKMIDLYGAIQGSLTNILTTPADVYAPCALGATLTLESIPKLGAEIVAGCANNQLLTEDMGNELHKRDILYAPDYVINAGGVIDVAHEITDEVYGWESMKPDIEKIYDTLLEIFEKSKIKNKPTNLVANEMAEERFN